MIERPHSPFFIPIITSAAGACLTHANWQEVGIRAGAFYLDELLMKPGKSRLLEIPDFRTYYGWPGQVILHVRLPKADAQGVFRLRSSYDGEKISFDIADLFAVIKQIQPDYLVFPPGILPLIKGFQWPLPEVANFFCSPEEMSTLNLNPAGLFRHFQDKDDFSRLLQELKTHTGLCYLSGGFDLDQLKQMAELKSLWIESDKPAKDAMEGRIYTPQGEIDILASDYEYQFEPLSTECLCPTCSMPYSRAYLHHLLQQTPLLCQRFLIQHNVWILNHNEGF